MEVFKGQCFSDVGARLLQTGEAPPVFRLDVNDRSLMTRDYGFWLENRLRQRFDLDGVPLVIEVRTRA